MEGVVEKVGLGVAEGWEGSRVCCDEEGRLEVEGWREKS